MKEKMDEYRADVGLNERLGNAECKCRDSPRRIGADARQRLQLCNRSRKVPAVEGDDLFRAALQKNCAAVVAQTLPDLQHI